MIQKHLLEIQDQIKSQVENNQRILNELQQIQYSVEGDLKNLVGAESRCINLIFQAECYRWLVLQYFVHIIQSNHAVYLKYPI